MPTYEYTFGSTQSPSAICYMLGLEDKEEIQMQ